MQFGEEKKKSFIRAVINKEEISLEAETTIKQVLEAREITSRAAVWVNGKQLLLAEYPTYIIQENDQIKILRVVAGG